MLNFPLITVVCVFFNRGSLVDRTVKSLLSQSYPFYEVILVDDGSTDDTYDRLNVFASNEKVSVYHHENIGFTASIKKAIEHYSCGEYIAIQGAGDVALPDRLAEQAEYLSKNRGVVAVGGGRRIINERTGLGNIVFRPDLGRGQLIFKANVFSHGEVMFRKSIYDLVGGYRLFFKYSQDVDLWLRMNSLGGLGHVKKILYEEYSLSDGVRNDFNKVLLQKKYNAIARYDVLNPGRLELICELLPDDVLRRIDRKKYISTIVKAAIRFMADCRLDGYVLFVDELRLFSESRLYFLFLSSFKPKFLFKCGHYSLRSLLWVLNKS